MVLALAEPALAFSPIAEKPSAKVLSSVAVLLDQPSPRKTRLESESTPTVASKSCDVHVSLDSLVSVVAATAVIGDKAPM